MAGCIGALQGEAQTVPEIHIPDTYHPSGKKIYHKGWNADIADVRMPEIMVK